MNHPMPFNRRAFVRGVAAITAGAGLAVRAQDHPVPDPVFTHGVASGDPQADRVILWTRAVAPSGVRHEVRWEVAEEAGFRRVRASGVAWARPDADWTLKVDAFGLPAGSILYYRFHALGRTSAVGRTRTLPSGGVARVRFAVVSCASYPAGYFHAYAAVAALPDVDAVLHLGDYLYEYGRAEGGSNEAQALGREVEPPGETLSLDDYRRRYAQYRSDPDLQAAHAALPFIAVWDDHEIANDAWRGGAENHQPDEGDFEARKAAAIRAFHEWMPTRLPDPRRPEVIHRSFRWGDLVDLHMLDTRLIGRDRQLAFEDYLGTDGFDFERFEADRNAPSRQLLGQAQTRWLAERMKATNAVWTVLGQQVLMAPLELPLPAASQPLGPVDIAVLTGARGAAQVRVRAELLRRLESAALPLNLDAWDGYAAARDTAYELARGLDKNLVVLAGDTHNAWASDLVDRGGHAVGVEFATPSITSPGVEAYIEGVDPRVLALLLQQLVPSLRWAQLANRGFMVVDCEPDACTARWYFVDTVTAQEHVVMPGRALRCLPGSGQRRIAD